MSWIWKLRCRTIPEWQNIRPRKCQTSQVIDFIRMTGMPLLGSGNSISGIQISRIRTPVLDASGVAHQSPSEMPDLAGDFNRTTGTPLLGSGELNSGDTELSNMDAPVSDDSGVADYSPSEMPDHTGDFNRKTGTPLWGYSESISGDAQFSDMHVPVSNG